jgi:hypothetical protein
MNTPLDISEAAILDRVVQPRAADWPRPAAEAILAMGFDARDREHMTALLEKAKDGELTPEESDTLEHYRHVGRLLELMKSRARHSLQTRAAA